MPLTSKQQKTHEKTNYFLSLITSFVTLKPLMAEVHGQASLIPIHRLALYFFIIKIQVMQLGEHMWVHRDLYENNQWRNKLDHSNNNNIKSISIK